MLYVLLGGLLTVASVASSTQETLFEEAEGWRVFKSADSCAALYSSEMESVGVFLPKSRDALTISVHASVVPAVSATSETVLIRIGKTQWGPLDSQSGAPKGGLPGIMFSSRRPKALAEFGKATSITITKRFQPPKTVTVVGASKAAEMLDRCLR